MNITVVICTFNRSASLRDALGSVEKCVVPERTSWEVLIVDNNSKDDTRAVCESFVRQNPQRFRYCFEPRQGKSFALNAAIENARGEILLFTDDDVAVHPQWVAETLFAFEEQPCVAVAGKIVPVWASEKPAWFSTEGPYSLMAAIVEYDLGEQLCDVKTPPFGANFAFKREVFAKYGLFRTDLGPGAGGEIRGEDTEYCRRVIAGKERFIFAPRAIVYHPVEKVRTEKQYFRSWYFDHGRALRRVSGVLKDGPSYFGVPRYLYRQLAQSFGNWMVSLNPKRRFYYRLQVSQVLGEMTESKRLCRARSLNQKATG
ncbi:MAG: glycosyltransferase [Candidatus Acidiferrum sp.]|jgi:glycosyltransferase involved in cell wall biosynthesis